MYYDTNNQLQYEQYHVEEQFDDDGKSIGDGAISDTTPAILTINYAFPITKEQWTAVDGQGKPLNMRYWSLINEGYDGDHSFEMRYACSGNYRDGKLVNDTHGKITPPGASESMSRDKYQLELNKQVW